MQCLMYYSYLTNHEATIMGAGPNNQNAKKPADQVKSVLIQMRVRPQDKAAWTEAAKAKSLSLSAYITETMNAQ